MQFHHLPSDPMFTTSNGVDNIDPALEKQCSISFLKSCTAVLILCFSKAGLTRDKNDLKNKIFGA